MEPLMRRWTFQLDSRLIARAAGIAAAIASCAAMGAEASKVDTLPAFMAQANNIFQGQGDAFEEYVTLHQSYPHLSASERRQAGQIISMTDTMFGRYEDASAHYEASFPPGSLPSKCPPGGYRPQDPSASIAGIVNNAQLVLMNESHSKVQTRASIIEMLPALKAAGYTHLALEALAPSIVENQLRDDGLQSRGYVRDDPKAGFYLREPIYAELVRTALALGFTLVSYESEDTEHAKREAQQADHIGNWLKSNPRSRLVVIAGYSHIWKQDGWMADLLSKQGGISLVSLDQVDAMGHCPTRGRSQPFAFWLSPTNQAWSSHPERVDATVTSPDGGRRGNEHSWLDLGGQRLPTRLNSKGCSGHLPCLIEARRVTEPDSVPADRWVAFKSEEPTILYLAPGLYEVSYRWPHGQRTSRLDVPASGHAHEELSQ
jgi:chloramphenicol 3-O-phosphotransferase